MFGQQELAVVWSLVVAVVEVVVVVRSGFVVVAVVGVGVVGAAAAGGGVGAATAELEGGGDNFVLKFNRHCTCWTHAEPSLVNPLRPLPLQG